MTPVARAALSTVSLGLVLAGCSESGEHKHVARSNEEVATLPRLVGSQIAASPRYVTLEEVRQHVLANTAVFIDGRLPAVFERGHIRGALNMPGGKKEEYIGRIQEKVTPTEHIIVYCYKPDCDLAEILYEYLAAHGYLDVAIFKPGWEALAAETDLR